MYDEEKPQPKADLVGSGWGGASSDLITHRVRPISL